MKDTKTLFENIEFKYLQSKRLLEEYKKELNYYDSKYNRKMYSHYQGLISEMNVFIRDLKEIYNKMIICNLKYDIQEIIKEINIYIKIETIMVRNYKKELNTNNEDLKELYNAKIEFSSYYINYFKRLKRQIEFVGGLYENIKVV